MRRCNFYLDDVDEKLLKEAAKLYNLSQAAVLRLLIRKYLRAAINAAKENEEAA